MSRKLLVLSLAGVLLALSSAQGQTEIVVDPTGAPDGDTYLKVRTLGGKVVGVFPLGKSLRLVDLPTNPTDPTNPPPPPPALTPFESAVKAQTLLAISQGADKTTGAAVSSIYSLVGEEVAKGNIKPENAIEAITELTKALMVMAADRTHWEGWLAHVANLIDEGRVDGSITTKEQYAKTLKEVANGINAATGYTPPPARELAKIDPRTAGLLGDINLQQLITFILMLLELLKPFLGM